MERMTLFSPHIILGLVVVVGYLAYLAFTTGRRPKDFPPGPPTIPILGNIHQMPTRDAPLQFEKWAREYGPVYSLMLGTKTMIVLSSDEAVKELLDRRSGFYSDRQEMYIGQKLCSGDNRMLMMGYGPRWRGFRKMCHALLNIQAAKSYVPYQTLENKQMLYEFLHKPNDFIKHIRRYSNALTTTMVYGWRTPTYEDPKMMQLFEGFSKFAAINQTGASALFEFFPILRRIPDFLSPTKRLAKELHRHERELYLGHWLNAKAAVKNGTIPPCFCVGMAEAQKADGFSDDQAAYIGGTLLEAGSDTTSSTLVGFVLAMLLYPETQKKAQAEIDQLVGDRLPTMEDEPHLQYVRGVIKESLRWAPTTPLGGVPHAVTKDDEYMGYRIPKGAGVVNNAWAIHMDPKRHPDPRKFEPMRYAEDTQSLSDSATNPDGTKRDQFTFGAGRRICQGIHVAERSLFLAVSRILWAFNIEPAKDDVGNPIIPDQEKFTQGFVCMPEPFPASIKPRSQAKAKLVDKEWFDAEREFLDPDTKQWLKTPPGVLGSDKA